MKRALIFASLLFVACSGEGNDGKLRVPAELIRQVPWLNGRPPELDADGRAIVPGSPVFPPIASGMADPGSRTFDPELSDPAQDCAVVSAVERSGWRHDFEPTAEGQIGVAQFWSGYYDATEGAWLVPGDAAWYTDIAALRTISIWGLASSPIVNGPSCGDDGPSAYALHVRGGRFNHFGGGVEHPLSLDCTGHQPRGVADLCTADAIEREVLDLSAYDGIAFWARRGPEGSTGLQIALQTKDTSDYLARSNELGPQHCRRVKECVPTCDNGAACVPFVQDSPPTMRHRCVPDGANPNLTAEPSLLELLYPACGPDACKGPPYYADPDFDDTQCKAYTFSGLEENYWCFGDEPPAAPAERCGDGFVGNVSLSTEWQFYKVPFDTLQQVGFAARAERFDLKNVYSVAFQFSVGFADFYVDNVSFYRNK